MGAITRPETIEAESARRVCERHRYKYRAGDKNRCPQCFPRGTARESLLAPVNPCFPVYNFKRERDYDRAFAVKANVWRFDPDARLDAILTERATRIKEAWLARCAADGGASMPSDDAIKTEAVRSQSLTIKGLAILGIYPNGMEPEHVKRERAANGKTRFAKATKSLVVRHKRDRTMEADRVQRVSAGEAWAIEQARVLRERASMSAQERASDMERRAQARRDAESTPHLALPKD